MQAAPDLVAKIATQYRAAVLDVAGVEPLASWIRLTLITQLNRP